MIYLKKNDLLVLIDSDTLDIVTSNNDALLPEAESRAIQEMAAYLSVRFDTDKVFDPDKRNPIVVMYLADIVLYHLHARIAPDNIPELRKERYNNAKDWLEKTADGFIAPLLPPKDKDTKLPIRHGSSLPKQKHYY